MTENSENKEMRNVKGQTEHESSDTESVEAKASEIETEMVPGSTVGADDYLPRPVPKRALREIQAASDKHTNANAKSHTPGPAQTQPTPAQPGFKSRDDVIGRTAFDLPNSEDNLVTVLLPLERVIDGTVGSQSMVRISSGSGAHANSLNASTRTLAWLGGASSIVDTGSVGDEGIRGTINQRVVLQQSMKGRIGYQI